MKKLTRRVFVLACAAVLTVSSIPISAEELGGASENADMSELGAAAGADSLPIDEDVLREHLCPLGGESDIQAVSGITIPASYDLTTSAYFPEKIAVDYALSTPQACVYYQYTYEVNRILGNLSDSDSTVYSPNWEGNSLSFSPFLSMELYSRRHNLSSISIVIYVSLFLQFVILFEYSPLYEIIFDSIRQ